MSASWQRFNGGESPERFDRGLDQPFDADSLVALRSTVAAHGDDLGLSTPRVNDLVLVAHELASNAVRHGGGGGRLRMWCTDGSVCCEVADSGGGFAQPLAGELRRPSPGSTGGRGLWIVAQLADELEVRTGAGGTVATVRMRLP